MNALRNKLNQLLGALEFANAGSFAEFETLLEQRTSPVVRPAATSPQPVRVEPELNRYHRVQVIDFAAFARQAAPKICGQHG